MYRRRRRGNREIAFSLDSFLDVITNVVGVIIRMILVVWVGARSYHEIQTRLEPGENTPAATQTQTAAKKIDDPLEQEIQKHRDQLKQAQESLLAHLRQLPPLGEQQQAAKMQLSALVALQKELLQGGDALKQDAAKEALSIQGAQVSMADLIARSEKLQKEIAQLGKLPVAKKSIQYRTPVSRKVESEELFFECQGGRVTFLDLAALRNEMIEDATARKNDLRDAGKLTGVTRPVGAFRLSYVIEVSHATFGDGKATAAGSCEPVQALRGETLDQAFQPTSDFRQIVDFTDPKQTVITFWVYPDSFPTFRQLRDYLYQRDLEVAARPIPFGNSIGFSPSGTASRSQ